MLFFVYLGYTQKKLGSELTPGARMDFKEIDMTIAEVKEKIEIWKRKNWDLDACVYR